MSTDLLRPPSTLTPHEALHRSQQAPTILASPSIPIPYPLNLVTTSDAPEKWTILENLFYSCLRTGDNASALTCLQRLQARFGETNERVMGLMGIYHEAAAQEGKRLEVIEEQYREVLATESTNFAIAKRRVAALKTLGEANNAIEALVELLGYSPTDAEAWAELADLYTAQGLHERAVYCLEEVLLTMPNAWNMQAKLAEILYIYAVNSSGGDKIKLFARSMKTFCRSIELCDDYLRGFYGLKLATSRLLEDLTNSNDAKNVKKDLKDLSSEEGYGMPSTTTIEKLNELATKKLSEIVRRSSSSENGWAGYVEGEVIAARELLDRDAQKGPR